VRIASLAAVGMLLAVAAASASGASTANAELARPGFAGTADFVQHLGEHIPAGLAFHDEQGRAVRLERYLGTAPVALIFTYYRCTNLCPMQVRKLVQRMAAAAGGAADAQVLVVSIDPLDTPALAERAKLQFLDGLLPAARAERWHDAASALARAALRTLDERERLRFDPARTPGEARRLLRDPAFDAFEREATTALFAAHAATAERFARLRDTYARAFGDTV